MFPQSLSVHLSLDVEAVEASSQSWVEDRSTGTLVSSSAMATSVDDEAGSGVVAEDAPSLAGSSSSSVELFKTARGGKVQHDQQLHIEDLSGLVTIPSITPSTEFTGECSNSEVDDDEGEVASPSEVPLRAMTSSSVRSASQTED